MKKSQNWNLCSNKVNWGRNVLVNKKEKNVILWIDYVDKGIHPQAWCKDPSRPDLRIFGFNVVSARTGEVEWTHPALDAEKTIAIAERVVAE